MEPTNAATWRLGGSRSAWRRRLPVALVPAFYAAAIALVYAPLWSGRAGIGWDLIESYWADLSFLADRFAAWDFPLWNPYERGGYPVHADPQAAIFYPVHWLFAAWGAVQGQVSWFAIQVKELLHHVLGCTLLYAFLRTRRIAWPAALLGGAAFALAGTWMIAKSNNFLMPMAWTPLVWIATDRLLLRPGWRPAAGLAAALYLVGSTGAPPGMFYAVLMCLSYGAFRMVGMAVCLRGSLRPDWGRVMAALGIALALTIATQTIIHFPTVAMVAESPRAVRSLSYAIDGYMGMYHFLLSTLSPTVGVRAYCGWLVMALAAIGAVVNPGRDQGAPVFFLITGAFFFVLSLGSQTPVLEWLVLHVPGFGLFRACARYSIPYGIFMATAAGYGGGIILDWAWRPRRVLATTRAILLGATLAALIATTLWMQRSFPLTDALNTAPASRANAIVWAAVVTIIACVVLRGAARKLVAASWVFIFLMDAPYFLNYRDHAFQPRPDHMEDWDKVARLPDIRTARVFDEFMLEQRAGPRLGIREFRGYTSFDPLASTSYHAIIAALPHNPLILPELNIKYLFHAPHSTKGWHKHVLRHKPTSGFVDRGGGVLEAVHLAPQVAWYPAIRVVPGPHGAAELGRLRTPEGVRKAALVFEEDLATEPLASQANPLIQAGTQQDGPFVSVAGRITSFETERVVAKINAPAPGVVVLNEAHHPGWTATVDGQPATVFRTDVLLRGILVDSGDHEIVWSYEPRGWPWLVLAWVGGMAVIAAAGMAQLRTGRYTSWLRPARWRRIWSRS